MASNEEILKFYDLHNIELYVRSLNDYGILVKSNGDFDFALCEKCSGPLLAHKKCIADEKTLHWTTDQSKLIISIINQDLAFMAALSKFDDRPSVSYCDICNKKMENRSVLDSHLKVVHGAQPKENVNSFMREVESKAVPRSPPAPSVLVKTPEIPVWSKDMKYEYIKSQIEAWDRDNRESDKKKFDRIVESFKKNAEVKELKTFATTIILSKLREYNKQTVPEILKLMDERFGRTKVEKIDQIVLQLKNEFKVEDDETEQSWWDKFDALMTDTKEIDLKENLDLFLSRWMILTGKQGKIISDQEEKVFRKEMKNVNDKEVFDVLEKSYKEEKLEGSRVENKTKKTSDTFYAKSFTRSRSFEKGRSNDRRSRRESKSLSRSSSYNGSNKRRSASRNRQRNSSSYNDKTDSVKKIYDKLDDQEKRLKNLENIFKEKKVHDTNFCSVERAPNDDLDLKSDVDIPYMSANVHT